MYRETGLVNSSPMSMADDAALLALVQRGDEASMAALFDRYSKVVYSVALRVLRDPAAAEDVLQEVFMQIWRNPDSFVATRGSLGGWLAVVAGLVLGVGVTITSAYGKAVLQFVLDSRVELVLAMVERQAQLSRGRGVPRGEVRLEIVERGRSAVPEGHRLLDLELQRHAAVLHAAAVFDRHEPEEPVELARAPHDLVRRKRSGAERLGCVVDVRGRRCDLPAADRRSSEPLERPGHAPRNARASVPPAPNRRFFRKKRRPRDPPARC